MRPLLTIGGSATPFYLGDGILEGARGVLAGHLGRGRALVVTDANVGPLHGAALAERLDAALLELPAGEEHKSWPTVETVISWLLAAGMDRDDTLVAVGGGVVTDLVGFAAAVALRGLAWVAVPTTLLGMVDASVGGKTGIDLALGKNLVGCFWPPAAILADPATLATLDPRQVRAGLVEVVKGAMIAPATLEGHLDRHLATIAGGDLRHAGDLIAAAVRFKGEIVTADERERGPRAALNLGHTVGHALEAATGYGRLLHGEAVGWGLLVELRIARERGLLDAETARAWAERLALLGPWPAVGDLTWEQLAPFVRRDKKRAGGATRWVLPRAGGVVLGVQVADDEASRAFAAVRAAPLPGA